MNTPDPLAEIAACNDQALNTLTRSLTKSQGEFTLILARCNYTCLRSQILHLLHQRCSLNLFELTLDSSAQTIYTAIHNQLGNQQPDAVLVTGLELVTDLDNLLIATNRVRDLFRKFPFPVVFWVTNQVCKRLIKVAMDLYNWSSPKLEFVLPEPALMALVAETAHQALADEDNLTLDDTELQAILQSYSAQGQNFPPEFHAILCLSLGIIHTRNNHIDAAIPYYQQSLTLWQEHQSGEQMGITSLHLAWAYALKGEQYQAEIRDYVQQAWQHLHQERCTDSLVHHSCKLGDLLRQVGDWEKLQHLAEKALTWHQQQGDVQKIAQDYGFLADVALNQRQWRDAQKFAQQGIKAWQQVSEFEIKRLGLCYFILAQSQQQLGQEKDAIATLATAREISLNATIPLHQYDPKLYVNILQNLRTLKFAQGDYLDAFHLKLEQRQIETQYGLRAFIGAGRLHPPRQVIQPGIRGRQGLSLSQIVASSGRQKDVEELLERIRRRDRKLTVIYGSSGVGKSSILQAGLVPILQQTYFEGRDIVPVLLQVYKDWIGGLDKGLVEALKKVNRSSIFANDSLETQSDPPPAPLKKGGAKRGSNIDLIGDNKRSSDSPLPLQGRGAGGVRSTLSMILNQLRQNEHSQLLTVLIFDQFEEFFFDHKDPASRREFYEFLRQCVEIPYVKVILSLREDYIYYLLELNRTTPLTNIDKNHEHILYYLGNFSAADAKSVIQSLTARSHLPFEPDLVDQLVQDLAKDLGEVRPIELQIVGYQLETEKITTLKEYRKYGSKEELVEEYLEDVIDDCGNDNKYAAALLLYLLTDKKNNRPLKSRAELETDIENFEAEDGLESYKRQLTPELITMFLSIFVGSGLIFSHINTSCYQICHDYLVAFIREKIDKINKKIKEKEQAQQLYLYRLLRKYKRVVVGVLGVSVLVSIGLLLLSESHRKEAEKNQIMATIKASEALFASGQTFESLKEALNAGQQLKQLKKFNWMLSDSDYDELHSDVENVLQQAIYWLIEKNRFDGHEGLIWDVSISPNGEKIASSSYDGTVRLWQRDGTLIQTIKAHKDRALCVSFSPDGQILATSSFNNTVKLWRTNGKNGFETVPDITLEGHSKGVYHVTFSPDDKIIATASLDGTVKLWDYDGNLLQTLRGHDDGVNGVSFSPDGEIIATASRDQTVKLWQRSDKNGFKENPDKTLKGHEDIVWAVKFSPDGKMIATASRDNTVKLWTLDGKLEKTLKGHDDPVLGMSFSPDGQMIASASQDKTVKVWNIEDGQLRRTLTGHGNGVYDVNFLDDKTLVSASADHSLKLWQLGDKAFQKTLHGHTDKVWKVSFSPDGEIIASASEDNTVKLWNRLTSTNQNNTTNYNYRLLRTIQGHSSKVSNLSFSPNGKTIATASYDNTVKIWTLNGKLFQSLPHTDQVFGVSFSPDGQMIATASRDNTVKLWTPNGKLLKTLEDHRDWVRDVNFSPDGQIIASASDDTTVKLWNRNGSLLKTLEGHNSWVMSVSFSPDGEIIASTSEDKTVKLWTVDGKLLKTLTEHRDQVMSVSFSPDGQKFATASDDKTVKLWTREGTLIRTLAGHPNGLRGVSFSPDGQMLALASIDNTVILWNLKQLEDLDDLADLREYGCTWLQDYLKNNPNEKERDRTLCDDIGTQE